MPLKKKNKLRNKIIFWLFLALMAGLMLYVPKRTADDNAPVLEYELY